jgi:hypothetical protein
MLIKGRALALITSYGLLLPGCGGGGGDGDGDGPAVPNAAVGGLWSGTTIIANQGTFELVGLVAENGTAFFLQEDGVMYWGTVRSSGSAITSTVTGAGTLGTTLWDGSASGSGSVTGTIAARTSVSGSSVFTTSLGGRATSTIALSYEVGYEDDSSLQLISGNYVDLFGFYAGVLSISSNGTLFLQDPISGCVVNGRVSIINPAYNAYNISFSYSNCTGLDSALNGVTFIGLAAYDAAGDQAIAFVQGSVGGTPTPNVFVFERV